jgi:hypothetical protein
MHYHDLLATRAKQQQYQCQFCWNINSVQTAASKAAEHTSTRAHQHIIMIRLLNYSQFLFPTSLTISSKLQPRKIVNIPVPY